MQADSATQIEIALDLYEPCPYIRLKELGIPKCIRSPSPHISPHSYATYHYINACPPDHRRQART